MIRTALIIFASLTFALGSYGGNVEDIKKRVSSAGDTLTEQHAALDSWYKAVESLCLKKTLTEDDRRDLKSLLDSTFMKTKVLPLRSSFAKAALQAVITDDLTDSEAENFGGIETAVRSVENLMSACEKKKLDFTAELRKELQRRAANAAHVRAMEEEDKKRQLAAGKLWEDRVSDLRKDGIDPLPDIVLKRLQAVPPVEESVVLFEKVAMYLNTVSKDISGTEGATKDVSYRAVDDLTRRAWDFQARLAHEKGVERSTHAALTELLDVLEDVRSSYPPKYRISASPGTLDDEIAKMDLKKGEIKKTATDLLALARKVRRAAPRSIVPDKKAKYLMGVLPDLESALKVVLDDVQKDTRENKDERQKYIQTLKRCQVEIDRFLELLRPKETRTTVTLTAVESDEEKQKVTDYMLSLSADVRKRDWAKVVSQTDREIPSGALEPVLRRKKDRFVELFDSLSGDKAKWYKDVEGNFYTFLKSPEEVGRGKEYDLIIVKWAFGGEDRFYFKKSKSFKFEKK